MGQCANKNTQEAQSASPTGVPTQAHGKLTENFAKARQPTQAVSLDRVQKLSSNPAVVSARFHRKSERQVYDDYQVDGKVLGTGLCGDVVLVRTKADGRSFALKRIKKQQVTPGKLKQLLAEVEIYLMLDHPNIARLHNVYETENEISLITECCGGGELYYRLQKRGVYNNSHAVEATRQMLRAVGYLHSHSVVHRDLKLENFLYESEDDNAQLKLIDFGFAKIWDPSTLMMASCGSIAYVSPDVLSGKGYTNKCDMWSLGVIVWMLLTGYPPFHGNEKVMMAKIKAGEADWSHLSRWKPVSVDAMDFIRSLLVKDPAERPDAQQALRHPWLVREAGDGAEEPSLNRDALRSLKHYADSSRLRRALLQLLAQELAPDETKDLRELFISIDKTNEGTICLKDLKEAIRNSNPRSPARRRQRERLGMSMQDAFAKMVDEVPVGSQATMEDGNDSPPPLSPTTPAARLRRSASGEIQELFSMLAANGDEKIYYSDFLAATMEARDRLRKEAVRATFDRLDADHSGSIGINDFKAVLGDTFEGAEFQELLEEVDIHAVGSIDFNTFVKVLADKDQVPVTPHGSLQMRSPRLLDTGSPSR